MTNEELAREGLDWGASSLLTIAKEHRENCKDGLCNISLFLVGQIYEKYVGRKLTYEESQIFI